MAPCPRGLPAGKGFRVGAFKLLALALHRVVVQAQPLCAFQHTLQHPGFGGKMAQLARQCVLLRGIVVGERRGGEFGKAHRVRKQVAGAGLF